MKLLRNFLETNLRETLRFRQYCQNFGTEKDLEFANEELRRWETFARKHKINLTAIYNNINNI